MKKWLALFTSIALFVLVACSGSNSSSTLDSSEQNKSNKKVTITFFQPGLDQPNPKEPVENLIKEFEKQNPNIKVKLQTAGWDQTYQKLVTSFQSGTSPDVIYGGTRWVGAFSAMKGILPLNKYAKDHIKLYSNTLQDAVTLDGKIYAIPRAFSSRALIYRSDLIKEPPKTWDELVRVAKKVQKEHPGIHGFAIAGAKHVSTTDQFFSLLFSNGGEVFDNDGNVALNSPEAVKTLQQYADFYLKDKIVPNPIEYNREELPTLFKEGKIAMFYCGPWAQSMMGVEPNNENTPYKTALLPRGKVLSNVLVSDSIMISAKTEHPDEAWKFVEYITSPEKQFEYDKTHGLVPIQIEEAKKSYWKEDSYFSTFVEMAQHGKAQPVPAAWEPFQDIITNAIQKALNGEDPKTVLDQAVQEIKQQKLEPK